MTQATLIFFSLVLLTARAATEGDYAERVSTCVDSNKKTVYNFTVKDINGKDVNLGDFRGKMLVILNVATYCGYTEQYNDFNSFLDKNAKNNLHMVAFPCNQFHLQEPAENNEIINGVKYVRPGHGFQPHKNIHFMAKSEVNGEHEIPLYTFLKESCEPTTLEIGKTAQLFYSPIRTTDVTWNFEKFLIDGEGYPRFRFHPSAWDYGTIVQTYVDELAHEKNT